MNKRFVIILPLGLLCLFATMWLAEGRADDKPADDAATAKHFDQHVAPIIAANCLSCHSGPKPKGELDLSTLEATMDAVVIEPGKPRESFLWEEIESDSMPPKHP